jgi:hypothetical protein
MHQSLIKGTEGICFMKEISQSRPAFFREVALLSSFGLIDD